MGRCIRGSDAAPCTSEAYKRQRVGGDFVLCIETHTGTIPISDIGITATTTCVGSVVEVTAESGRHDARAALPIGRKSRGHARGSIMRFTCARCGELRARSEYRQFPYCDTYRSALICLACETRWTRVYYRTRERFTRM